VIYSGANCAQCDNYRYPNAAILYNLCYPHNCQSQTIINCPSNCLQNYAPTASQPAVCLATNCFSWDSTGKCLQCAQGYRLVSNSICSLVVIPFCQTINLSTLACSTCLPGFDLFMGVCRTSNCLTYSTTNSSLCLVCNNGYTFNSNTFQCSLAKCESVSTTNASQCLRCLLGYSLQGAVCFANNCATFDWFSMVCTACAAEYELVAGVGICKARNCNNFDSNLVCTSCLNTTNSVFQLRGGICVSVDPNCISFDASGNCLACNNPSIYVNVGAICMLVVQGCQQYDSSGCISCLPAFTYSNGICQVKFCSSFAAPHRCSGCLPRFQLRPDSTCIPRNCLTFNNQSWSCQTCEPRFQLINSQFCFTHNCSGFSVANYVCTQCAPGFTLSA